MRMASRSSKVANTASAAVILVFGAATPNKCTAFDDFQIPCSKWAPT